MFKPDQEEIRAAAGRYLRAGLCCAVETHSEGSWQARMLALPSAVPEAVLEAVEETLAHRPGVSVRLAAYSPSALTRVALPAPVVCWQELPVGVSSPA